MVTTLRLLQIIVVLLTLPMIILGSMSLFSGGNSEALDDLSVNLSTLSIFYPIPLVIIAEIVYRLMKHTPLPNFYWIAVIIAALPLVMWANLVIRMWYEAQ